MKTKILQLVLLFLAIAFPVGAAPMIGDTYDAVIAVKGPPTGTTSAGNVMILSYPDVMITLREGKVSSLKAVGAISTVPERKITDAQRREAAASLSVAEADAEWSTDVEAALQQAKAQGRHVFLFFTGSDWCGWCMRLNKEILSTPEFSSYARENLLLVELDFPQRKAQSETLKAQNVKLAKKHGIRGYPTVIVLNNDGEVVGKLGYQAGGPNPFIAALKQM